MVQEPLDAKVMIEEFRRHFNEVRPSLQSRAARAAGIQTESATTAGTGASPAYGVRLRCMKTIDEELRE